MEALGHALSIAQQVGDQALELRTLVGLGHVEAYHLHFQESLQYDLHAIELASQVDEPLQETHALCEVACVLHHLGDLEGARRYATLLLSEAERLRNRVRLSQALDCNMAVALLEGNWLAARAFSDRGLLIAPRNPGLLGYRAIMEYTLGDLNQGSQYMGRLLDVARLSLGALNDYAVTAMAIPMVTKIIGVSDDPAAAEEAARVVLSSPGVVPVHACTARVGLALLASQRGDPVGAKVQYTALESRRGTMLGGIFESAIATDRLLALLERTMGNLDQALVHFEEALAFCRESGYRPEEAWTYYDYAEVLLQRNSPSDHSRAIFLLDEALSISTELGMRPLIEQVTALQEKARLHPGRSPNYPEGLTQREVEVLRLVTTGKRDREIAQELFISVTTVSTHVRNILNKINAANRTEATAYATRHGLV
jgi:DNA-binding CsgD family transcriptional regulator